MLYGLVTRDRHLPSVKAAISGYVGLEQTGKFSPQEYAFIFKESARVKIKTLIIDLTGNVEIDESDLRDFRVNQPHIRIIAYWIRGGREPGDPLLQSFIQNGVSDLLEVHLDQLTEQLKHAIDNPGKYEEAVKWLRSDGNTGTTKLVEHRTSERRPSPLPIFQNNKLIVIGSLYSGAGSTTLTLMISFLLNELMVSHAVVEYPLLEPDLYGLLNGDATKPDGYVYLSDLVRGRLQMDHLAVRPAALSEWRQDYASWHPSNPDQPTTMWSYEHHCRMMALIKQPIILMDVSSHFSNPIVREICMDADDIYFVEDTLPYKHGRRETNQNLQVLTDLKRMGKNVHIIANRDIAMKNRSHWLRQMAEPPICKFPEIPYKELVEVHWNGQFALKRWPARDEYLRHLYPVVQRILPETVKSQGLQLKRRKLFGRM